MSDNQQKQVQWVYCWRYLLTIIQQLEFIIIFNRMTFKQEYLHKNGPFPINFAEERLNIKDKITDLIREFHPNEWGMRGFVPLSFLQSFKQVYGIHSKELTQIIVLFLSYLKDPSLSCEANIAILKTLCGLREYRIELEESFTFDNKYFLQKLKEYKIQGLPFALKNSDTYLQHVIKMIKVYSKYGQEHLDDILQLAIEERDIKYIAIFIKSIKSQATAEQILRLIFEQSSIFERDTSFFYIICQLTYEFPKINLAPFHQTLSQQIIKSIMTVVDPSTDDQIKKLTSQDPYIGVQCTLKSIARILVNCLRPTTEPGWDKIWSCIERIFSIIAGLIDHSHEVQCMNDFLIFLKDFVKMFYIRYRKENGLYKQVNQDFIQQFHSAPSEYRVISEEYINMFNEIWVPLIPELLYLQDGQVQAAKILTDLAMFSPQKHLARILSQIRLYLQKDLTINSIYTPKMTILFLQEFIISNYPDQPEFSLLIQCCEALLDALSNLGIPENLDILQLVMRNYMYFEEKMLQETNAVEGLTNDIIQIIQQNLDPMSINLQSAEGQEAELYIDFKNIYFNFLIRLNNQQISSLCDKLLYKIKTIVPSHKQAYQFVVICLCYKKPQFAIKILDHVYKQVVNTTPEKSTQNGQSQSQAAQLGREALPFYLNFSLATKNQQNLRWYCSLIQCAFQYNPQNVASQWKKLEAIIVLMLREFDNTTIFDWGLDILFNIIINLQHIHLEPRQFYKSQNKNYKTMKDIKWIFPSVQCVTLLEQIKSNFYDAIVKFMTNRYEQILQQSERAQRIRSQKVIELVFDRSETAVGPSPIQIKQFMNQLLDCLLVPSVPTPQDFEERKLINKLLSIQYSVFSALQMRAQYTNSKDMFEISPMFIRQLGCFRKHAIQYLKWILGLLGHYNCLYDESMLKLFHFFWREAHDQLFFASGIQATNDKLHPFFYPILYKKKELFSNPFLITTECYLTFMMRIQLFHMLQPMASLNNSQYLEYLVPFSYSSYLDCSLKSYIPSNINPHTVYHFQVLNVCRLKLCLYYSSSYIRKFIVYAKAGADGINKIQKQKYLGAIRVIITNFKRNMSVFLYPCCLRDEASWYALQQTVEVSQYLEKKNDKVGIIEIIYLIIVFSFDFKGNQMYQVDLRKVDKNIVKLIGNDEKMLEKIVEYIKFLIEKIKNQINKKFYEKDATVLVLLLVCYSEFIPINHEIFQKIIPLAFEITFKNTEDMMNMGKSYLFRIFNRFIKKKVQIVRVDNIPVKRKFDDFLVYRHIGAKTMENQEPPFNLVTNKSDNYYYPLRYLEYFNRHPMNPAEPIQALLLSKIHDEQLMLKLFEALILDTELKSQQSQVDVSYLSEEQPKRIYSNGHKLINYILDSNPKKLDIYLSFIDNFSNYPICFYHRLFRKIMILGGSKTVQIFQKMAKQFIKSNEKEQVKLAQFLLTQLLPFSFDDKQFYQFYVDYLVSCSKEEFQFANGCLLVTFCVDWKISKIIFNRIIQKLRAEKGPSRLRHFDVFNNYLLCAGRFAQEQAKNGIKYLMGGIQEGTDQVSELIVSMLIYCFIIPINLNQLSKWVVQPTAQLMINQKIYKLDANTGYSINELVRKIIQQIVNKTSQEKHLQSKNLMIYSKLTNKILSNITVYRFNDQFYRLFKDMMLYLVNKPVEEGGYDEQIVSQFKDSEYPQHIYDELIRQLVNMQGNTINVMKKKLKYIESVVINKIYCSNQVNIPDIFESINQKNITIDHVVAASNMARIMKGNELSAEVERILNKQQKSIKNLNFMMAYLLAAGTRDFEWREKLLNQILSFKKHKIVKQFVSYWWKGRSPQNQNEQRLYMLVRSVENPYSYFA